jgi:hypothetical protein
MSRDVATRISGGCTKVKNIRSPSGRAIMTDKTIDLDQHRGMAVQKATELRRLLADVKANEKELRLRQAELESHLLAAPAANWHEAADKARYLLNLFAATLAAQDPRRQTLIAAVLADFAAPFGRKLILPALRADFRHVRAGARFAKNRNYDAMPRAAPGKLAGPAIHCGEMETAVGRRKCTAWLLTAHMGNSTRQVAPIGAKFRITDRTGVGG